MEKRFGVVSADGHCRLMHLPFDLWTKRLPRKFQDDGPRVVQGLDGTRQWVVEGRPWSGVGWAGVGRGPVNCYTRAGLAEEPEPLLDLRDEPPAPVDVDDAGVVAAGVVEAGAVAAPPTVMTCAGAG